MGKALKAVGLLVALLVGLAAAGIGWLVYDGKRTPAGTSEYVALGSSFGAGPGITPIDPNAPVLCDRSAANYAHLLSAKRNLNLTDMTCSGATAINVLDGGQFFQGPQIDALRPGTKLVTVTVGGNDISYLGNLFAWSCESRPKAIDAIWRLLVCKVTPQEVVQQKLEGLEGTMLRIADEVHRRSPQATLVFVDYATVLPDAGQCPDRLPITTDELDQIRLLSDRLKAVTFDVAQRSRATIVEASEVTKGHDICSAEPWVFGWTMPTTPLSFGPMGFHPTGKAMRRIADAVDQALH
ncbi:MULTISPECIES: SGNH/GDSL hydrolase family protein [unclassified Bradyrhizobium]|uniref:SGNH/GDSL hydrolase family protein n=1 Tax=unclassified Bradyrhizobium TaxID=2631580 RepID=UPI0028E1B73D|nr:MULTISPECIES: SGNH/GDSL hydrolase family protein [unclassified Bradyrhizobium]